MYQGQGDQRRFKYSRNVGAFNNRADVRYKKEKGKESVSLPSTREARALRTTCTIRNRLVCKL